MTTQKAGKRLLLVDDDDALRTSLAEQLTLYEEFQATEAETAAKGLERAKAEPFDLILLDVGLPDMDGRDACRLMRRNGVRCPAVACPEPSFPTCRPYVVGKYDQFDCCEQCIDPCQKERAACPPPPQQCPPGQFLGPAAIGDCCLSCQPLCIGVSCAGAPAKAADCPPGQVFQDRPASVNRCGDCCPKCVAKDNVDKIMTGAGVRAFALAVASVAVAFVAML